MMALLVLMEHATKQIIIYDEKAWYDVGYLQRKLESNNSA